MNDFTVIHTYTRAQAIEDGFLIELDKKIVKEAGFKFPIAVTRSVWDTYINWTEEDNQKQTYQDLEGRLWDVLWLLRYTIRRNSDTSVIYFSLEVIPRDGISKEPRCIQLKSICTGGDRGEPVITIMQHDEV